MLHESYIASRLPTLLYELDGPSKNNLLIENFYKRFLVCEGCYVFYCAQLNTTIYWYCFY